MTVRDIRGDDNGNRQNNTTAARPGRQPVVMRDLAGFRYVAAETSRYRNRTREWCLMGIRVHAALSSSCRGRCSSEAELVDAAGYSHCDPRLRRPHVQAPLVRRWSPAGTGRDLETLRRVLKGLRLPVTNTSDDREVQQERNIL